MSLSVVSDIKTLTAEEFLQQTYYMCEGIAAKHGVSIYDIASRVSFEGMQGEMLYMEVAPASSIEPEEHNEW